MKEKSQEELNEVNRYVTRGDKLTPVVWTFSTPKNQWMSHLRFHRTAEGNLYAKSRLAAQLNKIANIDSEKSEKEGIVDYIRQLVVLGKTPAAEKDDLVTGDLDPYQREVLGRD